MITIEVVRIDLAITIKVGVCSFDRFAALVVKLMINIEHIRSIPFAQCLEIVAVYLRTGRSIGCCRTWYQLQILNLLSLPSSVCTQVPSKIFRIDNLCTDIHFDTFTIYITYIGKDGLVEVCSGSRWNGSQKVFRLAGIKIETTGDAVFQQSEVEAIVIRCRCFPFQVRNVCFGAISINVAIAKLILSTILTDGIDR